MLAKKYRFHGLGSLRAAMRHGIAVRTTDFTLRALKGKEQNSRIGIIVSRKVSKSAVIRNRIRRRIYESVRLNWNLIPHPVDLVVIAHSDKIAEVDHEKLTAAYIKAAKDLSEKLRRP